ncbi:MAG TPA: hypothetical protein VG916_13230 [Gemmatimonadaceae bacterium]|nr:hypothetical protein [Gemmatimonadaceae bacterium]
MPAEVAVVRAFVARVARRLVMLAALEGAAVGLVVAVVLTLVGWPTRASVVSPAAAGLIALALGAIAAAVAARPGVSTAALAAEHAAPESRNLIVTALELSADGGDGASLPPATTPYVADVVLRRASVLAGRLDPARLFPAWRRALTVAAVAVVWVVALARVTGGSLVGPAASGIATIDRVDADVTPPAYTGRAPRTLRNPDRIELLEGSVVTLHVRANADAIVVRTADSSAGAGVHPGSDGAFTVQVPAAATGFVTLEPRAVAGAAGAPGAAGPDRLIGLTVVPDAAPAARVTAPGKDLVMPDGNRTLDVAVEAGDDIGIASLTLKYTKVSGSGERYTFVEGEVPLALTRASATAWQGRVHWNLGSLGLDAGDIVVYRAVVADARPGRAPVESDAFIAEVASPGMVAADGFALNPEEDRYALSQQMIVLKTARLIEGRGRLAADVFADSAAAIAAEQRRVRAEFVFMMGGEVNDAGANDNTGDLNEEAEAAGEADILAGREANQGRIALRRATRAMSLVARELDRAAADTALVYARQAVKDLEEAFSRNRILLRALAQREDLDPARRLSGTDFSDLSRAPRALLPVADDARARALRDVLGGIARLRRGDRVADGAAAGVTGDAREASALAERVLRLDPSSAAMQGAARSLTDAAAALARGDTVPARRSLDAASLAVAAEMRRALPPDPAAGPALERGAARGALADLLRGARP